MSCFRKSTAVVVSLNAQTLAANDFIEFTSANNVTGRSIVFNAGTTPVKLLSQGLYLVTVNANLLGTDTGAVTLQLLDNNVNVAGALATETVAQGDYYNVSFSTVIEVLPSCCCNQNTANLQMQVLTTGITVENASITVVKLA